MTDVERDKQQLIKLVLEKDAGILQLMGRAARSFAGGAGRAVESGGLRAGVRNVGRGVRRFDGPIALGVGGTGIAAGNAYYDHRNAALLDGQNVEDVLGAAVKNKEEADVSPAASNMSNSLRNAAYIGIPTLGVLMAADLMTPDKPKGM